MNYQELMKTLSCCGLGVILAAEDNTIISCNETGERLLGGDGELRGKPLEQIAPFLCMEDDVQFFGNPAFNRYLLRCPSPQLTDLPPGARILVFRDATKDFHHNLLENVFNHVREAITIWDSECRMLKLNDAAANLEAHLINDVMGSHVTSLYQTRNDSILVIPKVIDEKKPCLNLRQDFITHSGKELQILSNNYPIFENGQVVGATSLMDDWTQMDLLNKRIIELQSALMDRGKDHTAQKGNALSAKYRFNDIVYSSGAMRSVIEKCKQIAKSDSSVMIYGETGTGKELFAQSIHNVSPRAGGPFLAINCAAIPDTLLESMLFGTEKGAYTGSEKREGLFEQADKGTLLLDEVNSMNVSLQSKLLRVLQDGTFLRVGGSKLIHVDVRVISNLNIPPLQAIEQKTLRKDLYYRLGVINITIPPLRKRKEDILLLAKNFIMSCNKKLLKNVTTLDTATMDVFYSYDWPGNVRELQHAVEYAMNIIPLENSVITPTYLPEHILSNGDDEDGTVSLSAGINTMESVMQDAGRRFLYDALMENHGNISKTARALGITRQNLQYHMKKLGFNTNNLPHNESHVNPEQ